MLGTGSDRIHVGSSGWSYPEWRGGFYPADAQPGDFLGHYAGKLSAVELNATYYRLPSEAQFEAWAAQVPEGFRFAVKLSRAVVDGRLDRIGTFAERVSVLREKLGPVLVQLPEDRPRDEGMLRLLLDSLPLEMQVAVEPQHESWDDVELPVRVNSWDARQPFVYLRVRESSDLEALAGRIRAETREVWCFLNRGEAADHSPDGVATAEQAVRLTRLLG
jgi:uncharacterized protein YecE (DUF72 family)